MTVKTRFAPSPTGDLHVGGVRTALFAYLYARKHEGNIVLRIEDTDQMRSSKESVTQISSALDWLGLSFDGEVTFQSKRIGRYQAIADDWVARGLAYRCNCSAERLDALRTCQIEQKQKPKYDGRCRDRVVSADEPHVIRFKTPLQGVTQLNDLVYGALTIENAELDDLVILKSDNYPTYNFAVVVDDYEMTITHVIRGEDHVNNSFRQRHLFKAMLDGKSESRLPVFCHLPMILGEDKKRLSKRHGATSVLDFKEAGVLPHALLNYLVRLGWSHGDQEIFSLPEMIKLFDLEKINKSGAIFSQDKLFWVNHQHLKAMPKAELVQVFIDYVLQIQRQTLPPLKWDSILPSFIERTKTLKELHEQIKFLTDEFKPAEVSVWQTHLSRNTLDILRLLEQKLSALSQRDQASFKEVFGQICSSHDLKMKQVLPPLRLALTGRTQSPSMDMVLEWLSKDTVSERVNRAIAMIEALL